jgi:phosphocarrier protein FPr
MAGSELTVAVASGVGERHQELGTDAVYIAKVLGRACRPDGALVLMDLGSAVLSAEAALELLDPDARDRVRLCPGPLVEGAVVAAAQAIANGTLDDVLREAQRALAAKQDHLGISSREPGTHRLQPSSGESEEVLLTVTNEHGLHARPAATLIRALGRYKANVQITNENSGRGPAPARSMTSLALLQVRKGDRIRVRAEGEDRVTVLGEISALVGTKFGEGNAASPSESQLSTGNVVRKGRIGVPASDGIAIGPIVLLRDLPITIAETSQNPDTELRNLEAAIVRVKNTMVGGSDSSREAGNILGAQALILDDPVLIEKVKELVGQNHWSATKAWMAAITELSEMYQTMEDPYLRARAADVRDIGRSVVLELVGRVAAAIHLERPSILFTHELLASDAAECDPSSVLGVVAREGSPTSHSAILLRTRGIPMVVGVDWLDESSLNGANLAMDGATGELWVAPDAQIVEMLSEREDAKRAQRQAAARSRALPSLTLDNVRIEVLANVGNVEDAAVAAQNGAEGIGLLRSEFLFFSRTEPPSEDVQAKALREIIAAMPGAIVVRTFDVGADKPLAFLPQAAERNPFLGVRGIRLSLKYPECFLTHLRAILSAAVERDVRIMLPMVSVADELRQTRGLLERAHDQLEVEGRQHLWPVKLGAMIEVPSAALMVEQLAAEAEFFSIGTNDLTQYVMAVERGNGTLETLQDALHPAVLRLMKKVINAASFTDRHVSVCGDVASDPLGAIVFAGLGIRSLSVRPKQAAEIKALFRHLKSTDLIRLGHDALQCVDAEHVRAIFRECLANSSCVPAL